MSDVPQYGEDGFIPTVESTSWEGDTLVMETIPDNDESDIVGKPGEPLRRRAHYATDEQQEKLELRDAS